jgi:hypothetical protein
MASVMVFKLFEAAQIISSWLDAPNLLPTEIQALDYTKGFGHADEVTS